MKLVNSCILAFSMYSRFPTPKTKWEDSAMEYVFCFFPLVGGLVGVAALLWWMLADWLSLNPALTAGGCIAVNLLATGGIHMDGFCDTADALASHQSRERKLEILKDSHIGAFALIAAAGYLLLQFGALCQGAENGLHGLFLLLIPVLSRALSGLAAVTRKNARGSGLLATFTRAQSAMLTCICLKLWLLAVAGALLWLDALTGSVILAAAGVSYLYYYHVSSKEFGGITGDLAGWFLQICELACLLAVVLTGKAVAL